MDSARVSRLMIVGNPDESHVGAHFLAAAKSLGIAATIMDVRASYSRNVWVNRFFRRLRGKRPAHLAAFSSQVVAACREQRPDVLLVTGIAAPSAWALQAIGKLGIHRVNFATDDPWNHANAATFFWGALREYDVVYTPRTANLDDLRRHTGRQVEYLPFGYNPEIHRREEVVPPADLKRFACDVAVIGGADGDRLPIARALVSSGLKVCLYGGYWERDRQLREHHRGFVYGREMRLAVGGAKVNLCFGRKANRDGHAMRSFELPAMAATIVAERTDEHREIFGEDGVCVYYYDGPETMITHVKSLCQTPGHARALGQLAFERIVVSSRNRYADRLLTILESWN